ncbi:unnamed protein product [Echinostoma caproni]|uniref:Uncharacterized protein n=1 Tax=Echinostoma caproni TaxID=27848 RepID=A0A183A062_9TREM|nr:unnamed protein product [Echinostoma caproni]
MSENLVDYRPNKSRVNGTGTELDTYSKPTFKPSLSENVSDADASDAEFDDKRDDDGDTIAPLDPHRSSFRRVESAESTPIPLVQFLRSRGQIPDSSSDTITDSGILDTGNRFDYPTGLALYRAARRRLSNVSVTEFLASDTVKDTIRAQRRSVPIQTFWSLERGRRCSEPVDLIASSCVPKHASGPFPPSVHRASTGDIELDNNDHNNVSCTSISGLQGVPTNSSDSDVF